IMNLRALDLDEAALRLDGDCAREPAGRLGDGGPLLVARRERKIAHLAGLCPSALKTPVPDMIVRSPHQMRPFTVKKSSSAPTISPVPSIHSPIFAPERKSVRRRTVTQ